jgi:hypothetical protein
MGKAAESASKGEAGATRERQKEAEEALARAAEAVEKERAALADAAQAAEEAAAKRQRALVDKTKQAAERIGQEAGKESPGNAAKMREAAQSVSSAAGKMSEAAGSMESGQQGRAGESQQGAVEDLEKAREKLTDERVDAERRERLKGLTDEQEEVEKKARSLKDKLAELPKKTGSQATERASRSMSEARRQLGGGEGEEAEEQQKKAEDYLKQAEEELSEEQRRYRELQQEELLFRIQQELGKLIAEQERINSETLKTDTERAARDGALIRVERFRLKDLSEAQTTLAGQTEYIVTEIDKEGSQVFGLTLRTISDDMKDIAQRLAKYETGFLVQEIQGDVLRRLKDLEGVFHAELKRRQKKSQGQQGGGGKQPLVPPAAELLMLRTMQDQLNRQIQVFLGGLPPGGELTEMQREILTRLAARQGMLKDVWNRFVQALSGR